MMSVANPHSARASAAISSAIARGPACSREMLMRLPADAIVDTMTELPRPITLPPMASGKPNPYSVALEQLDRAAKVCGLSPTCARSCPSRRTS